MSLEETLSGWTGRSSDTEQEKQARTERMIRQAVKNHPGFNGCRLKVYTKGSYANNTNVRTDSDVDIAVQCMNVQYWQEAVAGTHRSMGRYEGKWTSPKLRAELGAALRAKFPNQVDSTGSTAFRIKSGSARVDADVVPCFDYRYYLSGGGYRDGSKVFKKNGTSFFNYPRQQLDEGRAKNKRTKTFYKKAVRIMKRVENAMVESGDHHEVPSYFVECLVYNVPDKVFLLPTWTATIRGVIVHIWNELDGSEPTEVRKRWLEANGCKFLFDSAQTWDRTAGRDFAKAAWNYLGFKS